MCSPLISSHPLTVPIPFQLSERFEALQLYKLRKGISLTWEILPHLPLGPPPTMGTRIPRSLAWALWWSEWEMFPIGSYIWAFGCPSLVILEKVIKPLGDCSLLASIVTEGAGPWVYSFTLLSVHILFILYVGENLISQFSAPTAMSGHAISTTVDSICMEP